MQRHNGPVLYSASDLVSFLGCEHSVTLALQNLDEPLPRAEDDASAQLVKRKGMEHERAVLDALKAGGAQVVEVAEHGDPAHLAARTQDAMHSGAEVVYQGTLVTAPFTGRTDFLRRVPRPSRLGDWSYEVVDTKLARSPKATFTVQLALYSDLLADAQGVAPETMHLVLGDGLEATLRVAEYAQYVAQVRERFLAFVAERPPTYPERCAACSTCPWRDLCDARWKDEDHLNQVAGITRSQIGRLQAAGVTTLAGLASLAPGAPVAKVVPDTLAKLRAQAALQVQRRVTGQPHKELLPIDGRRGFHRMPAPDRGDLFFDMEGDPLEEGGLEYLFGLRYVDPEGPQFKHFWAHDRDGERRAFEAFIDFVVERTRQYPGLHVYHYSAYEPTALKRLMTLHGTREAPLDDLLRREKFVDLYKVVRESMRTSEPGLSIKDLEVFYMAAREGDIRDAGGSIVHYEAWKQTRDPAELERIRAYNEDDCRSTQLLRDWLLGLRPAGLPWFTGTRADNEQKEDMRSDRIREIEERLAAYRARLLDGVPEDEARRGPDDHLRLLLVDLLDFHRRAAKPEWWALYERRDKTDDELVEDVECLGGLVRTSTPPAKDKRSTLHEYAFPEQETKLRAGKACTRCDTGNDLGAIHALDEARRRVTLRIGPSREAPDRLSIGPGGPIGTDVLREAVWRVADAVLDGDAQRFAAARAFLRRDPPSLRGWSASAPIVPGRDELAIEALRAVEALDDSYLFIQGPPGSGKTTIGSRLIVDLMRAGKRIGVTSNSHKVIHNLLDAVEERAKESGFAFNGIKKASGEDESEYESAHIRSVEKNGDVAASTAQLVAGTAWLFADPAFEARLDYLFVDEAGQVSLANLMAVATAARNLVLLGDHMQLGQPIQGVHPGRSGESALDFLLDGRATVTSDRGIFLPTSYRMHEDVCRFISDAVYESRLDPDPANQRRRLVLDASAHPTLRPTGIRFHPVVHEECKQRSPEEAGALREIVASLLRQRRIDKDGSEHAIALEDILVVAPYNAQVNLLREALPAGMRVGTIDRFQGQQAPVVLVSMTTSSGADLPRNIEFLYDKNRLNVAVSRAQCLAVVVASPALLHIHCSSPAQMALVNTLCWLRAYAEALPPYPA